MGRPTATVEREEGRSGPLANRVGRRRAAGAGGRRYRTAAFGVRAEVVVTDPAALVTAVELLAQEVEAMDRAASRFRPESEVKMLAAAGGERRRVSDTLIGAVLAAQRMAQATDGVVDPTVGAAMCHIGYDRDFAAIAAGVAGSLPAPQPAPGWRVIEVDEEEKTIRVPPGTLLDLGATAKALVADRVAARAAALLGCGVTISLGGDVAVSGPPPPGGFGIGVGDVAGGWADAVVAIEAGGLATSGVVARHWQLGGRRVHHIVDPADGLPVPVVWRTASVAARSCLEADAAATAAMVLGSSAPAWLAARGLPSRLVTLGGDVTLVGAWPSPAHVGGDDTRAASGR